MRWKNLSAGIVFALLFVHVPRAKAALDWDPVTDAEKSMKSNPIDPGAGSVVLFKRGQIDVIEKSSLFWTVRIQTYVRIKVFTEAGRDSGNVSIEAPKFLRMTKIEGRTILPTGETIPLDSSKVFQGKSYSVGSFAVVESSFTFPSVQPGAIIEYQIEQNEDGYFPEPWIFDTWGIGTLRSTLRVTVGPRLAMAQFPLETNQNKIAVTQNQSVQGSQYDFSVQNLRPIVSEPYSLPKRDLSTMIIFTPRQLGFSGEVFPIITKWDDVGNLVTEEWNEMQKSDKEVKNKARELAEKLPDPRKKAEVIYKYLQQNITSSDLAGVGIAVPADGVFSAKRGDPDEINAIFVLMLKEVKVEADMVLVSTQNWETLIAAFPNVSQFSRIVTRINFKDGALFADPADASAPFGELPWFDHGIQGLAVKGSKVQTVAIPASTLDENASTGKTTMHIAKDWSFEGDEQLEVHGAEAIEFRGEFQNEAPEKLEKTLNDIFGYANSDMEVSQVAHPDFRDSSQPFVLTAHLRERSQSLDTPSEFLLNPWLGDPSPLPRFSASARRSAVRFNNPEKRTTTSVWQLAPEIKVEQLPAEIKLDNDIAGYSRSCAQNDATLTCTRTFYLKKVLLATSTDYMNAKKFFDEIAKDDQEAVVLRKK